MYTLWEKTWDNENQIRSHLSSYNIIFMYVTCRCCWVLNICCIWLGLTWGSIFPFWMLPQVNCPPSGNPAETHGRVAVIVFFRNQFLSSRPCDLYVPSCILGVKLPFTQDLSSLEGWHELHLKHSLYVESCALTHWNPACQAGWWLLWAFWGWWPLSLVQRLLFAITCLVAGRPPHPYRL